MELQEFVASALVQILEAVREAQTHATEGGTVVPAGASSRRAHGEVFEDIEFDIAVHAGSSSNVTGSAKAGISVLGAGVQGALTETNASVSRIRFKVPVGFSQKAGGGR